MSYFLLLPPSDTSIILWPSRLARLSSSLSVSLQYLCQWHTPDKILQMSSFVIYLNPLIRPWLCSLPKQEQDLRWHTSFFRNNGSHVRGLVWLEINDGSSVGPKGEKCYQITTNKGVVSLVHIVRRKKIQLVKPKWEVEKKMLLLIWQNEMSSTKSFSECLPKPLMTYSQALWLNNNSGNVPNPARSPKPTWLTSIVPVAKAWYTLFLPYCFWLVSLPVHHKIVDIFKSLICRVYPASHPMPAGIGSSSPCDPDKWMDGWLANIKSYLTQDNVNFKNVALFRVK